MRPETTSSDPGRRSLLLPWFSELSGPSALMGDHLRQLHDLARPYYRLLMWAGLLTGLLTLIGLVPPLLTRHLINDVARRNNWAIFEWIIGLMIAVPLLRASMNAMNHLVVRRIHLGFIGNNRKRIFTRLMHLSSTAIGMHPPANCLQRLMGDVVCVSSFISDELILLLNHSLSMVIAAAIMLRLNFSLSLLALGLVPFHYLNYRLFRRRLKQNSAAIRLSMDHVSSSLQERLSAHELIQSFGLEGAEQRHFSSLARDVMRQSIKGHNDAISYEQLTGLLGKLGHTCIYCAGCGLLIWGYWEYGDVIAFCAYGGYLSASSMQLAKIAGKFSQVTVSIERITELLQLPRQETEVLTAQKSLDTIQDRISFNHVELAGPECLLLQDLNLTLRKGTCVAITGSADSGCNIPGYLLHRKATPSNGRIEIDGVDIQQLELRSYRRRVAHIWPESQIFDGTLRDNLLYGDPTVGEDWMLFVSQQVGLHSLAKTLQDGYDTTVGSGGLRLSAGTRQLVGITRALMIRPQILISDNATAVLDPESEDQAILAMKSLMAGQVAIFAFHRMLMARHADLIVVMDHGRLVEEGRYRDLLADPNGRFCQIFIEQYGHATRMEEMEL